MQRRILQIVWVAIAAFQTPRIIVHSLRDATIVVIVIDDKKRHVELGLVFPGLSCQVIIARHGVAVIIACIIAVAMAAAFVIAVCSARVWLVIAAVGLISIFVTIPVVVASA